MCGIAGMILREGRPDEAALARMAKALGHRGPDDTGMQLSGSIGLAQTRLSIIDLAGGHQPIVDSDAHAALVANGEIYNFVELRAELEQLGAIFQTRSDSECALRAWQQWGEDGVEKLRGMFACAIADGKNGRVSLWRDRFGIKPLYLARLPDRVLFASEIKALLAALPHTPDLNPEALGQFFQNQFSSGRDTVFAGIERVLPGERVVIGRDLQVHRQLYWSPPVTAPVSRSFEAAAEEFDELIEQAMREHMRSDVPYGLFLSGGVDSALLLAALSHYQDQPVRTFSVGYRDAQLRDELDPAARLARHFGTQHSELKLGSEDIFGRIPLMVWAADDLMRDYASLPTLALAEAAGAELKVVFSGEGGDEAFAGYRRYKPAPAEAWFKRLMAPETGGFKARPELSRRWAGRIFDEPLARCLDNFRAPAAAAWQAAGTQTSAIQRRQIVDIRTALPDNLLVKNDRMLMAFGLEGRVPFLDHRIVEFGLSLPDELKAGKAGGKLFLKRWGERLVPADHLWQRKRGFHVPVGEWFSGDFLRGLESRLPQMPAIVQWCRPQGVIDLLRRQRARGDVVREVFSLMQFAIWHRMFVEGGGERPPASADPLDYLT